MGLGPYAVHPASIYPFCLHDDWQPPYRDSVVRHRPTNLSSPGDFVLRCHEEVMHTKMLTHQKMDMHHVSCSDAGRSLARRARGASDLGAMSHLLHNTLLRHRCVRPLRHGLYLRCLNLKAFASAGQQARGEATSSQSAEPRASQEYRYSKFSRSGKQVSRSTQAAGALKRQVDCAVCSTEGPASSTT